VKAWRIVCKSHDRDNCDECLILYGDPTALSPVNYPHVIGEFETVDILQTGKSIARFGDGELKLMDGRGYSHQNPSPELAEELLKTLQSPNPNCLVGIPTMDPSGPKYKTELGHGWLRHAARFMRILNPAVQYYSAFITRPDSAPWINCQEYAEKISRLWSDKEIVIVSEKKNSIINTAQLSADVSHVRCHRRQAYESIDALERSVIKSERKIALLSCGPTATCLANRLSARGVQAIDIGSAGGFLYKLLKPKS